MLWGQATVSKGPERQQFPDPAPPVVNEPAPMSPPAARPHPRVTFHAAAKPLPAGAVTTDWPGFLGPDRRPICPETGLLRRWPPGGPKLVWELRKGTSYASPAIQADRLVYVHRMGRQGIVECLHPETGQLYWQFRYPTDYRDRFGWGNGPRATPTIDDGRVYVYSAEGKLFCLKLETGQLYWQRHLAQEFGVPQDFFGVAASPLVEGDVVIINVGAPGGPCVAAFDKRTGKLVWGAGRQWGPSYASPVPAVVHGRRRVLVFAGGESRPPTGGLLCIDPASGAVDFAFPWRSRLYESVNASSPVVVGNTVFISANYGLGSALVRIDAQFRHHLAWTNKDLGAQWNTVVFRDGCYYGFDGHFESDAALVCVDAATGRTLWRVEPTWDERIRLDGSEQTIEMSTYRGTLLWADGRFLCLGEFGHLLWLELSRAGCKQLARAWLFAARQTWTPPVVCRGLLYVCQNTRDLLNGTPPRLLCYDLRGTRSERPQ